MMHLCTVWSHCKSSERMAELQSAVWDCFVQDLTCAYACMQMGSSASHGACTRFLILSEPFLLLCMASPYAVFIAEYVGKGCDALHDQHLHADCDDSQHGGSVLCGHSNQPLRACCRIRGKRQNPYILVPLILLQMCWSLTLKR